MTRRLCLAWLCCLAACAAPPPAPTEQAGRHCQQQGKPRRLVCVEVPPVDAASEAQARELLPMGPGSTVYILRQHWGDDLTPVQVSAGAGLPLATLPRSLVRLHLAPGAQTLRLQWPGGSSQLQLQAQPGEVRVLRLEGWVFWSLRDYRLTPMDAATARPLAAGLHLLGQR